MSNLQKIIILCLIGFLIIAGVFYLLRSTPPTDTTLQDNSTEDTLPTAKDLNAPPTEETEVNDVVTEPDDTPPPTEDNNSMELPVPESDSSGASTGMPIPTTESVEETDAMDIDPEAKVFNITGKNFEFSVKQIEVNQGDTVTINFSSTDGFHDWRLDAFNAATDRVQTGGSTSVTFVADRAGKYEYYCSVGSHRALGMVGLFVVK